MRSGYAPIWRPISRLLVVSCTRLSWLGRSGRTGVLVPLCLIRISGPYRPLDKNGARVTEKAQPGYGVHIMDFEEDGLVIKRRADLWGPVVTDVVSTWYCRCDRQTNNTAELMGLVMALLWLWSIDDTTESTMLLVDSQYAGNAIHELINCSRNKALVAWAVEQLAKVRTRRMVTSRRTKMLISKSQLFGFRGFSSRFGSSRVILFQFVYFPPVLCHDYTVVIVFWILTRLGKNQSTTTGPKI
eukprot:SAG11_NODE_274_length_11310_cov_4.717510_2_plen_243_part_00